MQSRSVFIAVFALTLASPSFAQITSGKVLVKLAHAPKTDAEAASALRSLGHSRALGLWLGKRTLFGWVVANTNAADERGMHAAVAALQADKGVLAAEAMPQAHLFRAPDDPLFDELWSLQAIDAETAWDTTIGTSSQRVGLVDSGINRNHADLVAHDIGGFDFISDPSGAFDGNGRDGDYTDSDFGGDFHGSHVAGTMVASADDGIGIPGVNWQAGLMTARALSDQAGDLVDIAEGAAWLAGFHIDGVPDIGANRVSVINMSLGHQGSCLSFESDVYSQIIASGVVVVAAAGNDGNDVPSTGPADCPGVIDVAAFGPNGDLAPYSNFDSRIDIVAPGGDIDAGFDELGMILSVDGATEGGYKFLQGTSMASPHVAGVVSLMQAVNPQLSPAQIRQIFLDSPFTCGGCDNHSLLDAADAVQQALATPGELTGAPGANGGTIDGPGSSSDACAPHSQLSADGNTCLCDPGFVVSSTQDGCVPASNGGGGGGGGGETGGTCPSHSHESSDGSTCFCDDGFVVNDARDACLPDGSSGGDVGGDDGSAQKCDEQRGNWDCGEGFGCVAGLCEQGANGSVALGDTCDRDSDCDSGLCDRGVCTRPCDAGCSDGFSCEEDAIPGGLCRVDDSASGCSQMSMFGASPFGALLLVLFRRRRR